MSKIDFVYFDAGGGHRAAATALKAVIDAQKRTWGVQWDIRLVNLQEILRPLDVFRKVTGLELQEIYNQMLARGWTFGSAQGLKFMHAVIRLYHRPAVDLLAKYWAATRPDLVVSLVPNFNKAMFESLKIALPAVPYVTILTDIADYPPHFWMEKQNQYLICGSDKAVAQARALGYTEDRIFRASGMILRPGFYQPVTVDRAAERKKLKLDPDRPTGLVLFGGQGSKVMLEIAERLPETQLILICGKNAGLAERLRALPSRAPRFVEEFTSEIPYYMSLSDFFIGKPGPGSISEAIAMGLPVIVQRNILTLPQERYNADWVLERNAGLVLPNFRGIHTAVEELLRDLPRYQNAVRQIHNRAVFEIPELLAKILG
nr:putative 1,2-diacylglycerol 3-glucosyltransferase [uncultured bacterium]